jgi:hypothetical protein
MFDRSAVAAVDIYLGVVVKLLPLPQPPMRARTDAWTNPSAQRATQLRSVLARVYAVSIQNQITRFLWPPDRKTSLPQHSNKALRSSQQQHEVLHRRGRLGELPTTNPTISRGRAGLSNDPRHQKVSPRKLSSNRHSPGRRHFRPLGPHHFRCFLRHD